jgi:AcrR family transcriptional regulator
MSVVSEPPGAPGAPDAMSKRAARGRATRDQLIDVATRLFAGQGYEATSIEAVLAETGVSRGALYHHFAGKDALFEAVVESVEGNVMAQLGAVTAGLTDPVAALQAASLAWIDLAGDPVIQRVILTDAPSVLGWQRWRDMDEGYALGAVRAALQEIADRGGLDPHLVGVFAHMLLAAIDEIALVIARAEDPRAAMAEGRMAVSELLRRLLTP